jgi:NIMA (never in mitosis gene a)-related kinase
MCARQPPFNAKTHFELIQKIKLGRYPPIPSVYSKDLANVIASCLQVVPEHRPDTAKLLNLPAVKMMRKEQEVVQISQDLKDEKEKVLRQQQELERRTAELEKLYQELDSSLRREWEVKARLEIDRQVKQVLAAETAKLQSQFESEVNARVEKALAKYPARLSTSPRLAPRSNTPTVPQQEDLFPVEDLKPVLNTGSTSTVGTDSNFASGTDLSSLSIDDTPEEPAKKPALKRPLRRNPLARAQTMFPTQAPASPMDVQMADPSPAPAPPSLAGLSLSPRRTAPRQNIFAAAKEGKKWDSEAPPTPTHEEWSGEYFEEDDAAVLPSPTRARSGSNSNSKGDPTKPIQALPVPKPSQRLASAPSLAHNGSKLRPASRETSTRPASTVPIVAASPARQKIKSSFDPSSPSRRPLSKPNFTSASKSTEPANGNGMRCKKGMLNGPQATSKLSQPKLQPKRNNGIQGRTLVELQQARGIPVAGTQSDDELVTAKLGGRAALYRSPAKASPAVWDPEVEPDMPSPFIVRGKQLAKQGVA